MKIVRRRVKTGKKEEGGKETNKARQKDVKKNTQRLNKDEYSNKTRKGKD